jgi:uncharacterized protein (TIGR02145 family)
MKTNFIKVILALATFTLYLFPAFGQSPEKISYQAVVRDATNKLVINQAIGIQISILQGSVNGTEVYIETHTPTSNANGLVSVEIGNGTIVSGDFASINWANGPYFIKTETDPTGGTNYTIIGTNQLVSVPYALHAKTAETVTNETDPLFVASPANGITSGDIINWNNKLDVEQDSSVTNEIELPTSGNAGDMAYWNGTAWVILASPSYSNRQILYFINNKPQWVPPVDSTDVYSPITGKVWMDRNLGASRVATSSTDALAYGDLYQWGRAADGHEKRNSGTTSTLATSDTPGHGNFITNNNLPYEWRNPQNNNLWQGVSGTNNPCPNGYRLPTEAEWDAERTSWSSNNAAGAFASPLKLPVAGCRVYNDGTFYVVGSYGFYWSSTVDGTNASNLNFDSSIAFMNSHYRALGFSVRCIKD